MKWLAVAPQKWSHLRDVDGQLRLHGFRYVSLFLLWAVLFGTAAAALGIKLPRYLIAFLPLYVATAAIYLLGLWDQASHYNLEPPLVALAPGIKQQTGAGEIWRRFPKFVLGFLAASIILTLVSRGYTYDGYKKEVIPGLGASLSSAYASVRAEDGLCRLNDRYLAASCVCDRHTRGN